MALWFAVMVVLAAAPVRADDLSGTWVHEPGQLVVELRMDGKGALSGTVRRSEKTFAVRGKVDGVAAKGMFYDDFSGTFFEAAIKDDGTLEFVILESIEGEAEYARRVHLLRRKVEAPIIAGGMIGRLVPHPAGFNMLVPDGWRAEETGGALRLVPPSEGDHLLGPREVILVMTVDLGASSIKHEAYDKRVLHFLDSMVQTVSPDLRRSDHPTEIISDNRKGLYLEWTTDVVAPKSRRSRAWVTILGRIAVSLVASGPGLQLGARTGELRQIYICMGLEFTTTKPALMRTWHFQSGTRFGPEPDWATPWTVERKPAEEACVLRLDPEGGYTRIRGGSQTPEEGVWSAENGALHLVRGDVIETYEYSIEREDDGIKLRLRAGDRGEVWRRE